MVIRELTYQLHKLEASESALVSADHHDKKSVPGIGGKNPDRSIPNFHICLLWMNLKLHSKESVSDWFKPLIWIWEFSDSLNNSGL